MSKYEQEVIGNIVIIKNLIFQNDVTSKYETDHAWFNGRPCLIIYTDNEFDYFLTLRTNADPKYEHEHYRLKQKDILFFNSRNNIFKSKIKSKEGIKGVVNLQTIYKMPISGHDEIGKVTFDAYKEIILKLKKYHKNENLEEIFKTSENVVKIKSR